MDDRQKQIIEMVLRDRRRERIRSFIHKSKLICILDPYPYETHEIMPRTVAENYKRDKLRQTYSWHNISRLQNEKVYKAGLAGIVTAPILASIAINKTLFISLSFPIQMAFIFLSGILFVLGGALYNTRVPYFVKAHMDGEENKKYRAAPIRQIRSSIFFEFLQLGVTTEITPGNLHELQEHQMAFQTAGILLKQGSSCYKVGFNEVAKAIIEKFIYKLANRHNFKVFEEYKRDDGEIGLRERYGPYTTYPAGDVYIRHLSIEKIDHHYVTGLTPERIDGEFSDNDIVMKFYDPYIQTADYVSKDKEIEPYTHGLDLLLKEEYLDTIVEELSYWQSWQRPLSRVAALLLYKFSLLSFGIFLIYQASVVWSAI